MSRPRRRPRGGPDLRAARTWWEAAVRGKRCIVCGGTRELQGHHVLPQQALRKHGHAGELWNDANGAAVCRRDHDRHTTGVRRIRRALLPPPAIAFAERLQLTWLLERQYPT